MNWLIESVIFNFLMVGVDAVSVISVARFRRPGWMLLAVINVGLATCMLAILVTLERFLLLRLVAFGWFFHAPLVLLVSSLLIRKRRVAAIAGGLAALTWSAISVDAFLIEPFWLTVETQTLQTDKVTRPWRIVLVADLQTDRLGAYERQAMRRVMLLKPDMILMAGDYLQIEPTSPLFEEFNQWLREIEFGAAHGTFVVAGNNDEGDWQRLFRGLDATFFDRTRTINTGEIAITGLTLIDSFTRDLKIPSQGPFHIALGHAPDYAQGDVEANLMLAGHTHGGQVQLPFIGPLITLSSVPRSWASGRTDFDDGRVLMVSRGVGLERHNAPRLRFLCRPQLVVIDILPPSANVNPPEDAS